MADMNRDDAVAREHGKLARLLCDLLELGDPRDRDDVVQVAQAALDTTDDPARRELFTSIRDTYLHGGTVRFSAADATAARERRLLDAAERELLADLGIATALADWEAQA